MGRSFKLGKLFGVRIEASVGWFPFFVLVLWTLGGIYVPTLHPRWSEATRWSLATAGSLLFFGSVLAHELAHSLAARRFGISVVRITLFVFGGMAQIARDAPTPRIDAAISAAGPAASLVLAVLFGLLHQVLQPLNYPLADLTLWLAIVNGTLAAFNMIPGLPLDGGRLLRALIWWITGDRRAATRISATSGQGMAMVLLGYGLFLIFGEPHSLVTGAWPVILGLFVYKAAGDSYRAAGEPPEERPKKEIYPPPLELRRRGPDRAKSA